MIECRGQVLIILATESANSVQCALMNLVVIRTVFIMFGALGTMTSVEIIRLLLLAGFGRSNLGHSRWQDDGYRGQERMWKVHTESLDVKMESVLN